jgi:hypothetical protein
MSSSPDSSEELALASSLAYSATAPPAAAPPAAAPPDGTDASFSLPSAMTSATFLPESWEITRESFSSSASMPTLELG